MAKTSVILIQNIVGLGGESDLVKVAAGYARNYLFPQGLAVPVTAANKRRIEALCQRRADREAHEFNTMTELSKSISKLIAVVSVKTGEDGKLFGTVTAGMIADQLKIQFEIVLDKKKIHIEHPIKALGDYELELRLHTGVTATLKVRVESATSPTTPEEMAAKLLASKEKDGASKTESRGHKRAEKTHEEGPAADTADKGASKKARAPKAEKSGKAKAEKADKADKAE
jgi:large subunit ribosomal protein L9